jgi:hypothetical protein
MLLPRTRCLRGALFGALRVVVIVVVVVVAAAAAVVVVVVAIVVVVFAVHRCRCRRRRRRRCQEYNKIKLQIGVESFDGVMYHELDPERQKAELQKRIKGYAQQVYKMQKTTAHEDKVATVCQRENSFYIETVRNFRDRRYDYKKLTSVWGGKLRDAVKRVSE